MLLEAPQVWRTKRYNVLETKLVSRSPPYSVIHKGKTLIQSLISQNLKTYAVVTPLRNAASYEPRIAILGIYGDTWLTRGKYGIYVAVRGSYGVYVTPSAT